MRTSNAIIPASALLLLFSVAGGTLHAQCTSGTTAVLTGQYDNLRDSANSHETCLTPAPSTFFASDGVTPIFVKKAALATTISTGAQSPIYGQPLYVPNVSMASGTHNIVYVTALNDRVYAYDADNYGTGSPGAGVLYWNTSLISNCDETVNGTTYPGSIVTINKKRSKLPYLGIVSTPVIDPAANIMYVASTCVVTGPVNKGMQWFLNALKLGTGANAVPPVIIGGGVTNSSGSTVFVPSIQLQRSALLLAKDATGANDIYIAFGAGTEEGEDQAPYHGWLFSYVMSSDSTALLQQSVFTTSPTAAVYSAMCNPVISGGYPLPPNWCGESGGIWMSGRGPAASTINGTTSLFLAVSNGGFQTDAPQNWGESLLKFPVGAATAPSDSFTPSGLYQDENINDEDLGTAGVVLFDGLVNGATRHFAVTLDKAGNLFLMPQGSLGGFNTPDNIIQEFLATASTVCPQTNVFTGFCNEPHSLVYWNNRLYMWPMASPLRALLFSNGGFVQPSLLAGANQGFPGGILALSANGTTNGILWALHSPSTSRTLRLPGALTAFDATTLAMLWNSSDSFLLSTFAEPTVINGRVYVPTWDSGLLVYANH